jgi:hypothetical protein
MSIIILSNFKFPGTLFLNLLRLLFKTYFSTILNVLFTDSEGWFWKASTTYSFFLILPFPLITEQGFAVCVDWVGGKRGPLTSEHIKKLTGHMFTRVSVSNGGNPFSIFFPT